MKVAVCGFPSGKHKDGIKATEAARSVTDGANEVDMVIDIGNVIAGDWHAVQADVRAVREAIPPPCSKSSSNQRRCPTCRSWRSAGCVPTSGPTSSRPPPASTRRWRPAHAVELMRRTVGDALGVKASGGIRTWDAAVDMVNAGASRLGLSGTAQVLAGGAAEGDY